MSFFPSAWSILDIHLTAYYAGASNQKSILDSCSYAWKRFGRNEFVSFDVERKSQMAIIIMSYTINMFNISLWMIIDHID